jgi:hypothetical protein
MLNPVEGAGEGADVGGFTVGGWPNAFEPTAQKATIDNKDGRYINALSC